MTSTPGTMEPSRVAAPSADGLPRIDALLVEARELLAENLRVMIQQAPDVPTVVQVGAMALNSIDAARNPLDYLSKLAGRQPTVPLPPA